MNSAAGNGGALKDPLSALPAGDRVLEDRPSDAWYRVVYKVSRVEEVESRVGGIE